MQPIVNGLKQEFEGKLAFERRDANTGEGKTVMDAFGLRGHPSYAIVAPDGSRLWSASGQLNTEILRQQIEQYTR